MIAYPFDRRAGRDRRSGKDRRNVGSESYSNSGGEEGREPSDLPATNEEPRRELAEVWNAKGEDLLNRRDLGNAKHAFNKAAEIKPEFAVAWYNLARANCAKGEKEEAIANLKTAIRIEPGIKEKIRAESFFKKLKNEKEFGKIFR
jgi:tetratricopeptide (TPR) repeat protein